MAVEEAERRRSPRLPVELHVEFRHLGRPSETFADISRNLSEGGVFLATSIGLEFGTEVALEIAPGPGSRPIKMRAQVVRVEEEAVTTGSRVTARTRGMALSFVDSDAQEMARLLALVRQMTAEIDDGIDGRKRTER